MYTHPTLARTIHEERTERLRREASARDPGASSRTQRTWRLVHPRRSVAGRTSVASC